MTTTELDPVFRDLIDARLDAIERMLLRVRVSYSERRHIVDDVGSQIFELLARRGPQSTRDDVVAVLASLDPPEAYVPEEYRARLFESAEPAAPRGPQVSQLAVGSAIGGVVCLMLTAGGVAIDIDELELVLLFLGMPALLVTIAGVAAVIRILKSAGRLTGLPLALFAALLFPILLGNQVLLIVLSAFDEVGIYLLAGIGLMWLNYYAVRQLWRGLTIWRESLSADSSSQAEAGTHRSSGRQFAGART